MNPSPTPPPPEPTTGRPALPSFAELYEAHFDFAWRVARRLGVPPSSLDTAVQDVFLVVHDRLATFEGRSSFRTWLFGIVRRVVRDHRPSARERVGDESAPEPATDVTPHDTLERAESVRILHRLLDTLDDERREVFVLAELEQIPMPEVADALGINVNTAHARLRAARKDMDQALSRLRARDAWRSPWTT